MLVGVVGAHRAAEHDQAADAADVLRQGVAARHVQGSDGGRRRSRSALAEQPQALGWRMPKHDPGGALARGVPVLTPPWHRPPHFAHGRRTVKAYHATLRCGASGSLRGPGRRSRQDGAATKFTPP